VGAWTAALIGLGVALALYAALIAVLALAGRRGEARALASAIPDCVVLLRRLLRDPRLPRRRKVVLFGLIAYLAMPFDLVPDFVPVVGLLDDALLVAVVLRWLLRGAGPALVREHWPGSEIGLGVVLRLAGSRSP